MATPATPTTTTTPPASRRRSGGPRWFATEPAARAIRQLAAQRHLSLSDVAVLLRLDPRTVERVLVRPRLRSDTADTLAVALGCHPCELWPEWFGEP